MVNWRPLFHPRAVSLDICQAGGIKLSQKTVESSQSLICSLVSHRSLIGGQVEFFDE